MDLSAVWFVLAFALLLGLGITAAVLSHLRTKRRREAFRLLAQGRGWTFLEHDAADRPNRFVGWQPFGMGHSRAAYNVLVGRHRGVAFEAFGYQYTTTTTDSKGRRHDHVHHHKVLALGMPVAAPDLRVSRETVGKKLFDALGGSDIDFESDEFSRRFWVKCEDRKFASDCISPAMMEWLLANPSKWAWRWNGPQMLLVQGGVPEPAGIIPALDLAGGFVERIPRILRPRAEAVA